MPEAVVDASALAAVTFGEAQGAAVRARLSGATLAAPPLIWFELANVCLTKIRRDPDEADRLLQAFRDASRLALELQPVDLEAVIGLARETGLTAYDASYLWLSRHLSAELVTLDGELQAAAQTPS